jgi:hypothetical protein
MIRAISFAVLTIAGVTLAAGAATADPATTIPGDGTYVIGTDIAPGIYHTSGSAGEIDCYWERDSNLDGTADSIIANNISSGPQTVRISASDAAFQTTGCAPWALVAVAPAPAPAAVPAPVPPVTGSFGS